MKKLILFILLAFQTTLMFAQTEGIDVENEDMPHVKNFGGFLLDMRLMQISAPKLPKYDFSQLFISSPNYNRLFKLDTDAMYTQGYVPTIPYMDLWHSSSQYMQMGSFKLKNGMQLNTYGNYDHKGWRTFDPSALPWERDNFKGAFELKSQNGSFGVRIEVQQGRHGLY